MNDGLNILHQLLDKQERGIRSTPTVVPGFYGNPHDEVEAAVATLETAERAALISLTYGRRHEDHIIKRVKLLDSDGLYRFLGRITLSAQVREAAATIQAYDFPVEMQGVIASILERWAIGKSVHGAGLQDIPKVIMALLVCRFIQECDTTLPHMRRLSVLATKDSKFIEGNKGLVAGVLGQFFSFEDLTTGEVFETVGIFKNPHPIYIRGPLRYTGDPETFFKGTIQPFIGLLPEALSRMELAGPVDYVLMIENFASFFDYCSQIEGSYVAIFTSGVASRGRQSVIRALAQQAASLSEDTRFFHWGDIDGGGLTIFKQVSELVPATLEPHQMSVSLARKYGVPSKPRPGIAKLRDVPAITDMVDMLVGEEAFTLEQEILEPTAPDLANPRAR